MNIVSSIVMEVEKNNNAYQFIMPVGVPYGEAYDAAFEVLKNISEMSQKALEAAARKPDDSPSTPS